MTVLPEMIVVMYTTPAIPPVEKALLVAPLDTKAVDAAVPDVTTAAVEAGEADPSVPLPLPAVAATPLSPNMMVVAW